MLIPSVTKRVKMLGSDAYAMATSPACGELILERVVTRQPSEDRLWPRHYLPWGGSALQFLLPGRPGDIPGPSRVFIERAQPDPRGDSRCDQR